jgi:hypothetical protein
MKELFSDEILSAYLDGELTDQERADVERWVESNAAAREKLDEFRRLSGLFDGLPRTELTREFPVRVLQLAERQMLLPETVAFTARRRFHRRLLAVAAAIVSTAAMALFAVHLFNPEAPQRVAEGGRLEPGFPEPAARGRATGGFGGSIESGAPNLAQNERNATEERETPLVAGVSRGEGAASSFAPQAESDSVKSDGKNVDVASRAAAQARLRAMMKSAAQAVPDAAAATAAQGHERELAAFNESLGQIQGSGADQKLLSVVRLRVIDHAAGLELVQHVLSENNVVVSDEAGVGLEKLADGPRLKQERARNKEALFVVARPEQVLAAFTALLDRETHDVHLSVEQPIQIASLDPALRKQLEMEVEEVFRDLKRFAEFSDVPAPLSAADNSVESAKDRSPAEKPAVEKTPAADDAGKTPPKPDSKPPLPAPGSPPSENKKSSSTQRPAAGAREALAKEPKKEDASNDLELLDTTPGRRDAGRARAPSGRQRVAPVPRELEERQSRTAAAPAPPASVSATRNALPAPADARKEGGTGAGTEKSIADKEQARAAPSLVRVLIVIEPDDPRPAAPAAGKNPGGGA